MNQHETKDIEKILDSNVFFCSLILDLSCKIKIKKFINLCSVMQHYKGRPLNPQNFYAASKEMFNIAIRYYKNNNRKIKFYNLYISDTYGKGDNRRKILPTIILFSLQIQLSSIDYNLYLVNTKKTNKKTDVY